MQSLGFPSNVFTMVTCGFIWHLLRSVQRGTVSLFNVHWFPPFVLLGVPWPNLSLYEHLWVPIKIYLCLPMSVLVSEHTYVPNLMYMDKGSTQVTLRISYTVVSPMFVWGTKSEPKIRIKGYFPWSQEFLYRLRPAHVHCVSCSDLLECHVSFTVLFFFYSRAVCLCHRLTSFESSGVILGKLDV